MSAGRLHPLTPQEWPQYVRRVAEAGYLLVAKAGRKGVGLVWPSPPPPQPGACELRTIPLEQVHAAEAAGWIVPCVLRMPGDLLGPEEVEAWRARGRT